MKHRLWMKGALIGAIIYPLGFLLPDGAIEFHILPGVQLPFGSLRDIWLLPLYFIRNQQCSDFACLVVWAEDIVAAILVGAILGGLVGYFVQRYLR